MLDAVKLNQEKVLKDTFRQIIPARDIAKNPRIFIKPNLGGRIPILPGENNDYSFVKALCDVLRESGAKEIVIGHSPLLSFGGETYTFENLLKMSGFDRFALEKGITLLDLSKASTFSKKLGEITFEIPSIAQEAYYINVCKLKTHMETGVSLSLKNQMGLLPKKKNKMDMHRFDLDYYIAGLGTLIKPNLNIIDGVIAHEGNGPHHGKGKRAGIILWGDNMVAADMLACQLIGFDSDSIEHIQHAIRLGVGKGADIQDFKRWNTLKADLLPALEYIKKGLTLYVWPNKSCSGCIFSLSQVPKLAKKNPGYLLKFYKKCVFVRTDIVLGKKAGKQKDKYKNVFAIGNCTEDFVKECKVKKYLPGCPPTPEQMLRFLAGEGGGER